MGKPHRKRGRARVDFLGNEGQPPAMGDMRMTGPFVRPDVRGFLDYLESMPGPKTHELSPPEARQLYLAMKDIADPPVGDLACIENLAMDGPAGPIAMRLFDARATLEPGPAVVFLHAAGFGFGHLATQPSTCADVAPTPATHCGPVPYR